MPTNQGPDSGQDVNTMHGAPMLAIRALIVDDEPLAREKIRSLLAREAGFSVLGECTNGEDAVITIRRERPELVFLDVQMPGLNGIQVLERLGHESPPAVVFVTAFDQYAVRAFEFHAVDYLLKPIDRERFQTAMGRVTKRLRSQKPDDLQAKLGAMLADMKAGAKQPERIPIKNNGKILFINLIDIDWISSADNYVELHVGSHSYLLRETMNSIAVRLPQEQFVRVSRTAIVNVSRVQELQPLFHGEYSINLKTGAKVTLSRSHRDQLPRLGVR
jgi:two-component system, LytTR family, response regulator